MVVDLQSLSRQCGVEKNLLPYRDSNSGLPACSPSLYRLRNPEFPFFLIRRPKFAKYLQLQIYQCNRQGHDILLTFCSLYKEPVKQAAKSWRTKSSFSLRWRHFISSVGVTGALALEEPARAADGCTSCRDKSNCADNNKKATPQRGQFCWSCGTFVSASCSKTDRYIELGCVTSPNTITAVNDGAANSS